MNPAAGEDDRRRGLAIVNRRASMSHLFSRSAPGSLTLGQLTPFRSESGSSLPNSPSCNVGTQTPTDSLHFEYPDPFDSTDDGRIDTRVKFDQRFTTRSVCVDVRPRVPSFHSNLFLGGGVNRRMLPDVIPGGVKDVLRPHNSMSFSGDEVEGVGLQLRSIGDDFDRTRLIRSRSLSFLQLFTQGRRRSSVP